MRAATIIFAVVAIFHAVRLFSGWGVMIHTFSVPVWWSFVGLLIAGFMAWTGYRFWK